MTLATPVFISDLPEVSVIIPVFNKAPYLVETVQSLEAQGYPHLEILVADDGSTDGSRDLVDRLPLIFPRLKFRIFHKANKGVSDTRNYLLERVKTEWLVCLDGDDIMLPGYLHAAVKLAKNSGAHLISTDARLFGDEVGGWAPPDYDPYFIRDMNCIPTMVLYHRSVWESVGGYRVDYPFNEDWDFFLRASQFDLKVSKVPGALFNYRVTANGLAENYIKNKVQLNQALIITGNDQLYPVELVLAACETLKEMPSNWVDRFLHQERQHPDRPLLHLWLGLAAEQTGDARQAAGRYLDAIRSSEEKMWIPFFLLSHLISPQDRQSMAYLLHKTRTLRPDMARIVSPVFERIAVNTAQMEGGK